MDLFSFIKPFLFQCSAESAHDFVLKNLHYIPAAFFPKIADDPKVCMGLTFKNPIGLAAGFDKNGDAISALAKWGFGFIEVGTVTPYPQEGNAKPRLFRLPQAEAIINRMGFNNKGVDYLVENLKNRTYSGILGINIGKNASTPIESAVNDYLICLEKVYPYADYLTLNISSPNTKDLRRLQSEGLAGLLEPICEKRAILNQSIGRYNPILLKLAPDLEEEALAFSASLALEYGIDGLIATNTTISRPGELARYPFGNELGGLSGRPLKPLADQALGFLSTFTQKKLTLIGVGGIFSGEDALEKRALGADLVQIYSGLVYQGPKLLKSISDAFLGSPYEKN